MQTDNLQTNSEKQNNSRIRSPTKLKTSLQNNFIGCFD